MNEARSLRILTYFFVENSASMSSYLYFELLYKSANNIYHVKLGQKFRQRRARCPKRYLISISRRGSESL